MESTTVWPRCAEASDLFTTLLDRFAAGSGAIGDIRKRLLQHAGIRMEHVVDHWELPPDPALEERLHAAGLCRALVDGERVWEHPEARFPTVRFVAEGAPALALRVEDAQIFLAANSLTAAEWQGAPDAPYHAARCRLPEGDLLAVARKGYRGFRPKEAPGTLELSRARQAFRLRLRSEAGGTISALSQIYASAEAALGADRATEEFFAAEREFYMARNAAARWQCSRQQEVGIGWANHDHHTYRSSRENFCELMSLWRLMGFKFRERYYAGAEAGWGAQIVEHEATRIVLFSDVDLAAEELDVDFSSEPLAPRKQLGTIGLWCALHGDSIAAAGLHHLEAEFDFQQECANLRAAGYEVMKPFTDMPILKQAFTVAEPWRVAPERAGPLVESGGITREQASQFAELGAAGSHLEVLQRWEGFKGFNKTGVSAIIRETDARRAGA